MDLTIQISNYPESEESTRKIDNVILYNGQNIGTYYCPIQMNFWEFKKMWLTMLRFLASNQQVLDGKREWDHQILPLIEKWNDLVQAQKAQDKLAEE